MLAAFPLNVGFNDTVSKTDSWYVSSSFCFYSYLCLFNISFFLIHGLLKMFLLTMKLNVCVGGWVKSTTA